MEKYEIHLFNLEEETGREAFMKLKNKSINQPEAKGKVTITTSFYMKNRATESARMDENARDVDKDSWQEQWVRVEVLRKSPAKPGRSTNINNM